MIFGELMEAKRVFESTQSNPSSLFAGNEDMSKEGGKSAPKEPALNAMDQNISDESDQIEALRTRLGELSRETRRKGSVLSLDESEWTSIQSSMEELMTRLESSVAILNAANCSVSKRLQESHTRFYQVMIMIKLRLKKNLLHEVKWSFLEVKSPSSGTQVYWVVNEFIESRQSSTPYKQADILPWAGFAHESSKITS